MNLFELLKTRRSRRKFSDRNVEKSLIEQILKATLTAPSSKNCRSSRFMVVEDAQLLEKISEMRESGAGLIKNAPMAVLVMGDTSITDMWVENCSISATILQLCAESAGLGSCWVQVNGRKYRDSEPDSISVEEYLRGFLPISPEYKVLCVVAIGYATDSPNPHKDIEIGDKALFL